MRVLHIFDRWLNQTMNWAYHPMAHNGVENHIAALVHVRHPFDEAHLKIAKSPIQSILPTGKDEWEVSWLQKAYGSGFRRHLMRFLKKYIASKNIDLVHVHFANVGAAFIPLLKQIDVPFIVSFYGYDYEKVPFQNPNIISSYQWIFTSAASITTEGPHGKSILIKMGCDPDRIAVVPLGIPIESGVLPKSKKPNKLKLVQAATLTPKKGQLVTLGALDQLDLPNLECTFLGELDDTKYSREVMSQIESLPNARFKPFIAFDQFDDEMAKYDILIQPSQYAPDRDCEGGAPLTLVHAQAVGLPVISTNHCDIPNVVRHGKTGLLVPEGESHALAQAISDFYKMDTAEFSNWSQLSIRNAQTHFDVKETGRKLFELYSSLGA